MATFLDYLPGQRAPAVQAPVMPPPTTHPAVVSYLASGSPLRQGFVQNLQALLPPGGFKPPGLGSFIPPGLLGGLSPSAVIGASGGGLGSDLPVPTAPSGGQPVSVGNIDYQADPILQEALAAQAAGVKTARGNLLAQYEDLLLGFGSQELAKKTLNKLLGQEGYKDLAGAKKIDKYLASISDNPDTSQSTLGKLARALREATISTNEGMSSSQGGNLFFSGARAKALRNLDYQHQSAVSDATQALRQALFGASQGELATEQGWRQQILAAEEAAYSRELEVALANAAMAAGLAPGASAGGGGGGGGGNSPAQVTPATATPAAVAAAISSGAPWNTATPLSTLSPNDIRVRRLQ